MKETANPIVTGFEFSVKITAKSIRNVISLVPQINSLGHSGCLPEFQSGWFTWAGC